MNITINYNKVVPFLFKVYILTYKDCIYIIIYINKKFSLFFFIAVNPTSLDSGFHYAEILAYNTESEANPLFK